MTQPGFVRARRPEHKHQRREAILTAARELAQRSGVGNVSLGGVAVAVGLAKSNVVRYFGTREEIYLELAAEAWQEWEHAVGQRLRDASGAQAVVVALAETLAQRPLFCDILSQTSTNLERNVSVAALKTFKTTMMDVLTRVGALIAAAHPELTEREGLELVTAAARYAAVLYPTTTPSPALVELYAQEPDIAALCPPFVPTLTRMFAAIIAGLPTLR